MMELLNGPGFLSSQSTLGSDVSYCFAVLFTVLFLYSGYQARQGRGRRHHRMILVSMLAMIVYFLYYYEVRRLGVASLSDEIAFAGPEWVYRKVFRPILFIHFIAVTLSTFTALYMIVNGFRTAVTRNGSLVLNNERVRISKTLWAISFVWLAFLVWWMVSVHQFGWTHQVMFLVLGYVLPAGLAITIQKALPESERRHRMIGRLCLGMFTLLLVTSTLVYFLLYILEY